MERASGQVFRKLFVRCAVRGVRPFVRCGGSELRHDRFAVHPVEHVDDQRIPVLEARIEDRFAVRGLVVFVQHARAFVIPPEQGDGLRCQLLRLLLESVFDQSAPRQVVRHAPDRAEPCRGVAAGFERVHFLHFRQRAHAVRGVEGPFVGEVFAYHAFGLLRGGDVAKRDACNKAKRYFESREHRELFDGELKVCQIPSVIGVLDE